MPRKRQSTRASTRRQDRDGPSSRRAEKLADDPLPNADAVHRLRGVAYDDDFDDAEGDSSAVTNRRSDGQSDS